MSDDLVKRLRAVIQSNGHTGLCREAAGAIERLTAERDAAWEAGRDAAAEFVQQYFGGDDRCAAAIRALATSKPE